MSKIEKTFEKLKQENRKGLIPFIMAGDPDIETAAEILKSLPDAGADIIEIGMPFTDPVADGPTIQAAGQRALANDTSLRDVLDMVRNFRAAGHQTPIVLMGYANPIHHYGFEAFARDAGEIGIDGVIIVDLPPEESGDLNDLLSKNDIDLIRLITPTTDETRLQSLLDGAGGFLYYVSITGVTGTAKPDLNKISPHLDMIRKHTSLPLAVGFGIQTPDDAAHMAQICDAVVVGSSIVKTIETEKTTAAPKVAQQVQALKAAL